MATGAGGADAGDGGAGETTAGWRRPDDVVGPEAERVDVEVERLVLVQHVHLCMGDLVWHAAKLTRVALGRFSKTARLHRFPDRQSRALAGLSMGGGQALSYAGFGNFCVARTENCV